MAQTTATMSKLRGRHYAARARAAQITTDLTANPTDANSKPPTAKSASTATFINKAKVSNESLARRLNSTRAGSRFRSRSPSTRDAGQHATGASNGSNSGVDNTPATNTRDRTTSRIPTGPRSGRVPYTGDPKQRQPSPTPGRNTNSETGNHHHSEREMEIVKGISDRLETGLNEDALGAILDLLKRGESPDAIVAVVTSLAQHAR